MTVRFKCDIEWTITCDVCGDKAPSFKMPLAYWSEVPWPSLPSGWIVLDGVPICGKHIIEVKDAASGEVI